MLRTTSSPHVPRRAARALGVVAAASALAAGAPTLASAADGPSKTLRAQALTVKPQIVGGSQIQVTRAPWHVSIEQQISATQTATCGGSILDARHILTAAHCTFNPSTDAAQDSPAAYTVEAGISNTAIAGGEPGDAPQTRDGSLGDIAAITRHPYYVSPGGSGTPDQFVDDVAVITLATPLNLDGTTAAPIALPAAGPNPGVGSAVFVAGFGLQQNGGTTTDGNLYGLDTSLVDASLPDAAGPYNAQYLVTQSVNGSTCQGDSGGGLVTGGQVVGVVSNGARCGAGELGLFTAITAGENLTFVRNVVDGTANPIPRAPAGGSDVSLRTPATPEVGDTLTCSPGTWTNNPAFTYVFSDATTGQVLQAGPVGAYRTVASDAGRRISCRVAATTPGGTGVTLPTQGTAAVRAAPAPAPAPTPKPAPKPDPARLSASIVSGSSAVKQGSRVAFRITVRNTGDVAAKSVRTCVRVNSRFAIVSRGGAKLSNGRLCWTTSSLKTRTTKRFSLRADRDAKVGRVATTVSVTAPSVRSASARRVVTIQRRATAAAPGGVTG